VGSASRWHEIFKPAGTNVNFIQIDGPHKLRIRTYERGVEGETLACGTGAVGAALIAASLGKAKSPVAVTTRAGTSSLFRLFGREKRSPTCSSKARQRSCVRGRCTYKGASLSSTDRFKEAGMFKGSMVAIVTPFKNGKVDEKALGDLIEFRSRTERT